MLDTATARRNWFHNISDQRFAAIYELLGPESPATKNAVQLKNSRVVVLLYDLYFLSKVTRMA